MPCTYILYSRSTNKFYTGSSREKAANNRLKSHNAGKTKSTKAGRPWIIIHQEKYQNYTDARKREIFLKSGQGRKYIKTLNSRAEGCQSGRMGQS
ncbi:MAG: hypothetical protein CMI53_01040 [Parcubacteria group bacterium]|nr:hypothetical protein [Parcubacteria group bacterium]|tara:strand:+ start:265 stop:549 length:285 start_codon:yes stop_codon:yes gene_type:complete